MPPTPAARAGERTTTSEFVLRTVQPALLGLTDGSISTPGAALRGRGRHAEQPRRAAGRPRPPRSAPRSAWVSPRPCPTTAASPAAAIPLRRGRRHRASGRSSAPAVHSLPFLIPHYETAMTVAVDRRRARAAGDRAGSAGAGSPARTVRSSIVQVTLAGVIVFAVGVAVRRRLGLRRSACRSRSPPSTATARSSTGRAAPARSSTTSACATASRIPPPGRELRERWEAIQFELVCSGAYRPYKQVLAESLRGWMDERGLAWDPAEGEALVRSMRSWQPFPDTRPALTRARDAACAW